MTRVQPPIPEAPIEEAAMPTSPSTSTAPAGCQSRPPVATPQLLPTPDPSASTPHASASPTIPSSTPHPSPTVTIPSPNPHSAPTATIPSPSPHPAPTPTIPSPAHHPSPCPTIPPPTPLPCSGSDVRPPTPQSFLQLSPIPSFDLGTPPDMQQEPPSHSSFSTPSSAIDPPHVQAEQAVGLPTAAEGRPKRISKAPPCGTGGHKHGHNVGPEASDEGHARPPPHYTRRCKIQKSECPEECREAVSSLMFAAARFSDLPELRDLRQMFQERYGNSLELFVNQEFVTHLTSKPTTLEKKVKLMQDIAREFSIKWDAGAFEKRMSKPPTYVQNQPKTYGSFNVVDEKTKSSSGMKTVSRGEKDDFLYKERLDLNYDGHKLCNGKEGSLSKREELDLPSRRELSGKGYKALNGREETILKKDGHDTPFEGRQEIADDKHEERSLLKGKPEITSSCAGLQSKSNVKAPFAGNNHAGQLDDTSSVRKVERNEINKVKPYHNSGIPPPYVKSNVKTKASRSGFDSGSSLSSLDNDALVDHSMHKRGNAGNTSGRIQSGSDYSDYERQVVRSASVSDHGQEKDLYQDNTTGNPLPKSKSSRRRHLKSHSHHDDAGYFEDAGVVTRNSRSRRRDDSRRGLQILFDDEHYQNEAEERILDKLLMQYSKKPSSYEPGRMRRKSKPHHAHHMHIKILKQEERRSLTSKLIQM
uniref:Uncharacterized protein n=1 Tax=Quercus lobata TaxID=97700 RepID=A0A7N2MA12_QUELO